MLEFKPGDIVTRKSHGEDILFRIMQVVEGSDGKKNYLLKGMCMRLLADSTAEDLQKPESMMIHECLAEDSRQINNRIRKILLRRKGMFRGEESAALKLVQEAGAIQGKSGKVLHIDGDVEYLGVCLRGYKSLGVDAIGRHVAEQEQPEVVGALLRQFRPDILVVTGHDGMVNGSKNYQNLSSYRNSGNFAQTVKRAREYQSSYDSLVIFAGACQSYFEIIVESGANFASSPYRVLIHAMDPVFICEKIAFASITKYLSPQEILENTLTGERGIGGLQTRGSYREGSLKSLFS